MVVLLCHRLELLRDLWRSNEAVGNSSPEVRIPLFKRSSSPDIELAGLPDSYGVILRNR